MREDLNIHWNEDREFVDLEFSGLEKKKRVKLNKDRFLQERKLWTIDVEKLLRDRD